MISDPAAGNVLVVSDDRETSKRLGRWIAAIGERPVLLSGAAKALLDNGDDEIVDLVVTHLDTTDPSGLALLRRLIAGELLSGVPRLHVFPDAALRETMVARDPSLELCSLGPRPKMREIQARVRLASEIGRLRRELSRTSIRDPMTGLINRRYLIHRLEEEFARARRYRWVLSIVMFDIDQLREINDAHGQDTGDAVIRLVGEVLEARVRKEDVVGRAGEESFCVLLGNNHYRGAAVFASNVRTEIARRVPDAVGEDVHLRISAGISSYPDNGSIQDAEGLLRAAESALDEAKARGGNRVFIDEAVLKSEKRLILVVDPDHRLLELAEDLLSLDDYRVVLSDSPATAMETLRFRRPDLLVVDLQLSDNGSPLIEKIHGRYPGERFPTVGLSRDPDTDPEHLQRLGVDRFITKPFSLSLLRSVVRELLDSYKPVVPA
jgi:diguanylate cyclase (GGDEF)-like protein